MDHAIEVSSQLRQQLDSSTARCAVLDAELAGARLAVSAQQKNSEVAQTDRQALARKVAELAHCEVDLSIAQNEMTQLKTEAESLRSEVAQKSKTEGMLARKEVEVAQLQTVASQLRAEVSSLKGELAEAQGVSEQLLLKEAERISLQAQLSQLGSELESMRSNSHSMLSRHTQQAAELAQLRSELNGTQSEVTQLRSALGQAQAEATHKSNELSQLQPELESLRQQSLQWASQSHAQTDLAQKESELKSLEAEMSQLRTELDSAQQLLPDEALPSDQPQQSRAEHLEGALDDSAQAELALRDSWQPAADSDGSRDASPTHLAESASVTSLVTSRKHSEAMSESELRKMAEAFRKSLCLEVSSNPWATKLHQQILHVHENNVRSLMSMFNICQATHQHQNQHTNGLAVAQ